MKRSLLILLTISSINLLSAEEQPQPESTEQVIFRRKRNSCRLNTGYFPAHAQDGSAEPNERYSKTYFNYKQNDDGSITISAHSKKHGYATTSYKHAVTLSPRDLAHLEALHSCLLNQCNPEYCAQIAGITVTNMYQEIKVHIPLFFEYLQQLRNQQTQS